MATRPIKPPENKVETILVQLYEDQPLFVERLPYTEEFDRLFRDFVNLIMFLTDKIFAQHDVWELLLAMRKQGKLPNKVKETVEPDSEEFPGFGLFNKEKKHGGNS